MTPEEYDTLRLELFAAHRREIAMTTPLPSREEYDATTKELEEHNAIACETCGKPTNYLGTRRCNICWEVESRLQSYLCNGKSKARNFVMTQLKHVPPYPYRDDLDTAD